MATKLELSQALAQAAHELVALRTENSELKLKLKIAVQGAENPVSDRRAQMQQARAEAMRTGKCVKVH